MWLGKSKHNWQEGNPQQEWKTAIGTTSKQKNECSNNEKKEINNSLEIQNVPQKVFIFQTFSPMTVYWFYTPPVPVL